MSRASTVQRPSEFHTEYSVTHAVVEAVADAEGVEPTDLTPPLATVIDPDALETFVASIEDRTIPSNACIEFTYNGYEVSVSTDGTVDVSEQ